MIKGVIGVVIVAVMVASVFALVTGTDTNTSDTSEIKITKAITEPQKKLSTDLLLLNNGLAHGQEPEMQMKSLGSPQSSVSPTSDSDLVDLVYVYIYRYIV